MEGHQSRIREADNAFHQAIEGIVAYLDPSVAVVDLAETALPMFDASIQRY